MVLLSDSDVDCNAQLRAPAARAARGLLELFRLHLQIQQLLPDENWGQSDAKRFGTTDVVLASRSIWKANKASLWPSAFVQTWVKFLKPLDLMSFLLQRSLLDLDSHYDSLIFIIFQDNICHCHLTQKWSASSCKRMNSSELSSAAISAAWKLAPTPLVSKSLDMFSPAAATELANANLVWNMLKSFKTHSKFISSCQGLMISRERQP